MIVITNPPFSLFREYMDLLFTHNRRYLIIGNQSEYICKDIFPEFTEGRLRFGHTKPNIFALPDGSLKDMTAWWYTNLPVHKQPKLKTLKTFSAADYPKYDNYDAYECSKVARLPDCNVVLGVPVTYAFNPDPRFEILGIACGNSWANYRDTLQTLGFKPEIKYGGGLGVAIVNGRPVYSRLLIRRKT